MSPSSLIRVLQCQVVLAVTLLCVPLHAQEAEAPQVLRIGGTLSASGSLANFSEQVGRGLQMWVEDINDRGGLLGKQVELVTYDDASNPDTAVAGYRKLIADGIDLLISPYSTGLTLAVRDAIGTADIAMVSIASSPSIWASADPRIFGLYTPADHNMDPFLDLLADHDLTRLALVHQASEFPSAVAAGVRKQAAARGITLVLDKSYPTGNYNFEPLIGEISAAQPQAVVVGSYLDDAVAFTRAAHTGGLTTDLIAFSGGPALREFGVALDDSALPHGAISTVQWMRDVRMPGSFDFGFRYRRLYQIYPSYDAAGGYAAGQVLEAALRLANDSAPTAVRRELQRMKFRSILGHYRVDERGQQTAKKTYLVQWQGVHISLVYPSHLARYQVLYPLSWNR